MQVLQGLLSCKHQLVEQFPNLECRQCLFLIQHSGHIQGNSAVHIIICHSTINQVMLLSLIGSLTVLSYKIQPRFIWAVKAQQTELHPKSWTRKSTKGVQKSMGKELFSEELKLAVVQYVLEGHTRKEASEKFCVSCTPIEKWVNLYKLHGAKGLLSRNLVGRQKGFDGEFRLKVLQYKQEHHLSCTQTAMHFCLDVVTVCRWEKKFQKEGAQGLMKKQATKGSEKRQKKQEQSELQQENKRLSEENYRLKMENDYLKKLNALIQKREKPE